jgi:dTDP-4-amino-4,6-dideoxygalactose transaminase
MLNWVPNKKINIDLVNSLLEESLKQKHFTNYGPNVRILEDLIRKRFVVDDNKSVIVVNNGSVALHILTAAIEYKEGKKLRWATQSFTFPPSAQSNLHNVDIIDIDLEGGLQLEGLDKDIDGIIVTNIFGNIVDIDKYETWAKVNNKYLIFDNAATCYTFYKGKNCVNHGTGCGISFHHTKPFGFGEGGAIIIDSKYEKEVRCLINFGIGLTDAYFVSEGNNGKMSDISAAYITQYLITHFDIVIKKHIQLYAYLKGQLTCRKMTYIKLFPSFHDDNMNIPACFPILFDHSTDKYEKQTLENEVYCRKYYIPLKSLVNSDYIYNHILCFPCTIEMTTNDVDKILDIISKVYTENVLLNNHLPVDPNPPVSLDVLTPNSSIEFSI